MGRNDEIGKRIAELRDICGYSQEDMASMLELDLKAYVAYEDSGEDIPIGAIFRIANICGVDFTEILTGVNAKLTTFQVVRSGEGLEISRNPGYCYRDLAFKFAQKIMEPTMVTIEPGYAELNAHSGQEFNLVLKGTMKLVFNGHEVLMNEGDSAYLNATVPHGHEAIDAPCTFLAVISE
jgi:Uncharacterized conserved protein, contains double-stranded beta-helix domain